MPRKATPTVYFEPPKQSGRDILAVLRDACQGDIHGVHPCGYCNYCTARKHIEHFRKCDKRRKEAV